MSATVNVVRLPPAFSWKGGHAVGLGVDGEHTAGGRWQMQPDRVGAGAERRRQTVEVTASTRLSTESRTRARPGGAENAPPGLLAACTTAVPGQGESLDRRDREGRAPGHRNAETSEASEIQPHMVSAIRLIAIDRPIAAPRLAPLGLLPVTVMAIATPPASAVIVATSRASTRSSPDVEICERTAGFDRVGDGVAGPTGRTDRRVRAGPNQRRHRERGDADRRDRLDDHPGGALGVHDGVDRPWPARCW